MGELAISVGVALVAATIASAFGIWARWGD